jgi:hypothetical protein
MIKQKQDIKYDEKKAHYVNQGLRAARELTNVL